MLTPDRDDRRATEHSGFYGGAPVVRSSDRGTRRFHFQGQAGIRFHARQGADTIASVELRTESGIYFTTGVPELRVISRAGARSRWRRFAICR